MKSLVAWDGLVVGVFLSLAVAQINAAPVKVTEWNLMPSAVAGTNGWSQRFQTSLVKEAAEGIRKEKPDVVVLQHVAGWQACDDLVAALAPEHYEVAVCSSFWQEPQNQVAILSRVKPYIAWDRAWESTSNSPAAPGGYAFAAIKIGGKNTAIFSAQFSDGHATSESRAAQQTRREESARQLLRQVANVQTWRANRIEAFVVAGDFNTSADDANLAGEKTLPLMEQAGFANAFADLPLAERVTLPGNAHHADATMDYVFARDTQFVGKPVILPGALAEHSAVVCVTDVDAPKLAPAVVSAPKSLPASVQVQLTHESPQSSAPKPASANEQKPAVAPQNNDWVIVGIGVGMAVVLFALWLIVRGPRNRAKAALRPNLQPVTGPSISTTHGEKILITPAMDSAPVVHIGVEGAAQTRSETRQPRVERLPEDVRAGVAASLSRWLREKLTRRLIADRADLMATQRMATMKLMSVDERLTKIERQIQQRNHEYEARISELEKELMTAREENRELIRAKIAQIKLEMERAAKQGETS